MSAVREWLAEIGGFASVSLQPAAGAHGEFTGILIIRAYHLDRGDAQRTKILIPDSAHGTNPASTTMSGLHVVEIPSDERGNVDLEALRTHCDDTVAGLMLTNPNTLGLFEEQLKQVVDMIHGCGGLMYGDGANLNALLGIVRPGDVGFDVLHYNLHKTFSTPHGGGGPGSGPVGVAEHLADFLPGPVVQVVDAGDEEKPPLYGLVMPAKSIGRMAAEIAEVVNAGVQVGLVIGAGNIFRGKWLEAEGLDRVTGDHMGMLATIINALAMQDALEQIGTDTRVMSALQLNQICEDYIRRRAVRHLEKGRVVIFAAGTGNPFFTTDSAASLRAIEVGADIMLKATKVDGVYSADPIHYPDAERYTHLSYDEVLHRRLGVMDATAIVLCRDNGIPLRVFSIYKPGALMRAVMGENEGTLVSGE